jgi:hypothetical protein
MRAHKIDFRLSRDFGEVINATFQFVQQNFKKLFSCILFIGGPFVLLSGLSIGVFQSNMIKSTENFATYSFSAVFVYLFAILMATMVVMATVYHYIYLYMLGASFEVADVWRLVRRDFWKLFFSGMGVVFVSGFGLILCFLPGIYLFFALTPVFNIQTYERLGFFDAVSRSFKLISQRWWRTFGIWFVMSMVQGLISFIVVSPLFVAMAVVSFLTPDMGIDLPANSAMLLYIIAQSLNNIVSLLCGALVFVAMAFHYFSLVEEKEGLGLMEKIRMMGTQRDDMPEEEEEEEY